MCENITWLPTSIPMQIIVEREISTKTVIILQDSYFLEMAGLYLHFVVQFAILILINIDFASASYHQIYTTFTNKKSLPAYYTILQPVSEIQCLKACFEEGGYNRCGSAGYDRVTNASWAPTVSKTWCTWPMRCSVSSFLQSKHPVQVRLIILWELHCACFIQI